MDKKHTFLRGKIIMPLQPGAKATIAYNGQFILTSPVAAILEVSADRVVIETQNTVYSIAPDIAAVYPALLPAREDVAI